MKYKVLGVQRKQGEYNGTAYDNCNLHVTNKNMNVTGEACSVVKVKTVFMSEFLAESGIAMSDLIGKTVNVGFDQYGRPESIDLVTQSK